jgi:hypothetical protein
LEVFSFTIPQYKNDYDCDSSHWLTGDVYWVLLIHLIDLQGMCIGCRLVNIDLGMCIGCCYVNLWRHWCVLPQSEIDIEDVKSTIITFSHYFSHAIYQ